MKSFSNFLHNMPWWALLMGGLASFIALAVFVTPFHLINLQKSGATPEENRAIKREVDLTFSEGAVELAGGIVKEMRDHTKDPTRREELDRALEEIESAKESLREAGAEVQRAKREAAENVKDAVRDASKAIAGAQKEAARALKEAGIDNEVVTRSLEESAAAAKKAEEEARRAALDAKAARTAEKLRKAQEKIQKKLGAAPPLPPPPRSLATAPPEAPALPEASHAQPEKNRIVIMSPGKEPLIDIDLSDHGPGVVVVPSAPLPPEVRAQIREKVTGDLWRIGVGSGLILIFIPLFILAVISKFFIDRSRASLQLAELKRKEAEYHRMGQQVTEAKLSALQAQVEPHFLYNTLASVQALTEVDPKQASAMTGHLIQYLRNALPKMRESVSTVGQEIELVRAYLNILQMRMGKRLTFEIDVPAELMEAPFPPLMLPSLVENAIKHGLEPQREGGEVRIGAECSGETLRVIVSDTGRGFGDTVGAGVGLTNIRERLAAMYGAAAKLTLTGREPHGVVATIEVPRDGARAGAGVAPSPAPAAEAPAQPAAPRGKAARTLAVMGAMERGWRKGLTFTFFALVVVAAVVAGLSMLGVMTGTLPVHMGDSSVSSAAGAFLGTAGIAIAFAVVVLALAIVLAVVYGLGFLALGIAIFIPLVVLVGLFPVLAPFLLLGLGAWWLMRRNKSRKAAEKASS